MKLTTYIEKHSKQSVVQQIEIVARKTDLNLQTNKQKEVLRKTKVENLLKEVHFLQVTESPNHHLIQLQIHDELLKPGSTTQGSYTHGDDHALAVSSLSDLIKEKIKEKIADSDSIGIQMDESTDITKKNRF